MSKLIYDIGYEGKPSNDNNEVDTYFNNLASVSAAVDSDNTRTECISSKHIEWDSKPVIKAHIHRTNPSTVPSTYTAAVWTDIAHGSNGSTSQIFPAITIDSGDVIRHHFNIWNRADSTGYGSNGEDYWWLKIEYLIDGVWTLAGYVNRNSTEHYRPSGGEPVDGYRSYQLSAAVITTGVLTGVRAQIKLESVARQQVLTNWNFSLRIIGA
jgi:hypothetical protein